MRELKNTPKSKPYYEEESWKAKKVFEEFEKKQKSTFNYKHKNIHNNITHQNYSTNSGNEVIVKITGSGKNYESLKNHIDYISRDGSLDLESRDEEIFVGKSNLKEAYKSYDTNHKIPTKNEIKKMDIKEKRETINIIFSMKDHKNVSTKQIKEAAKNTIQKLYPNNYFLISMHNDTDNPHCHMCLKIVDDFGKRIDIRKSDINNIRSLFAKELNKLGVNAKATIKNKNYLATKEETHKNHHYKVLSFGEAHYKFDTKNEKSFYVRYKTKNDKEVEIWSKDLKRVIENSNLAIGDYARFAIVDNIPNSIIIKKDNEFYKKTSYSSKWDVSIKNKNEKILNAVQKLKTEYEKCDEPLNEIIEFGVANYKFDETQNKSFYVKLKNYNGKIFELWNKNLEKILESNKLKVGDKCLLKFDKEENRWNVISENKQSKNTINLNQEKEEKQQFTVKL